MNCELLFINWAPSEIAFSMGHFAIRWYSLCWCIGLFSVYLLCHHLYRQQKVAEEKFDPLFIYCFLGILVGARLGHCLLYEPQYYLASWHGFVEMLLPIKFIGDDWKFIGYEGLASHGGTVGLMFALWLYVKNTGLKFRFVLDDIAIVTPICACAIRMGNLMNSEIIGNTTDVPWAFKFWKSSQAMHTLLPDGSPIPRHPGQLYEALCYALFFFIGWWFYKRSRKEGSKVPGVGTGFFFGLCITLIFASRFFIEFTKEVQGGIDNGSLPLDAGQIYSIPFVILGVYCMVKSYKIKGNS